MKLLFVLLLAAVLVALAGAGVFMLRKRDDGDARRRDMARALALRVALSILLFAIVLLSWLMGWIKPSGLPAGP